MGYYYGYEPMITSFRLQSPKIRKKTVFAVIADLHECVFGRENSLLLSAVGSVGADAVIIAGDLVSATLSSDCENTMGFLKRIAGKYPVFYGVGNHEHRIMSSDNWIQKEIFEKGLADAGVELMRNTDEVFGDTGIHIHGLDLPQKYYRRFKRVQVPLPQIGILLGNADQDDFSLLIAHNPQHFQDYEKWKPDLIVSGHVHGGVARLPYLGGVVSPYYTVFPRFDAGMYCRNQTRMLVSRGLGSHTIPFRINNKPEIIRLELDKER